MAEIRRSLGDNAWVEFKASGYPFSLRRKLKEAGDDESIIDVIAPFVTACHLPTSESAVTSFRSKEDLSEVDEVLVTSIIYEFYDFRAERLREPLAKNT